MDRGPSISVVAAHKLCCGSICRCNSSKQDRLRIATTTTTKWWTFTLGTSLGSTGCLLSSFGSISSCLLLAGLGMRLDTLLPPLCLLPTDPTLILSSFLLCLLFCSIKIAFVSFSGGSIERETKLELAGWVTSPSCTITSTLYSAGPWQYMTGHYSSCHTASLSQWKGEPSSSFFTDPDKE